MNTRGTRVSRKADIATNHVLTADVRRVPECGSDIRVQIDHEVTLLSQLFITVFDLLRDPLPEAVAAEGVDDIDDPLPRQLMHILLFWQVQPELFIALTVPKDGVDSQSLVHGHVQVLCLLRLEA